MLQGIPRPRRPLRVLHTADVHLGHQHVQMDVSQGGVTAWYAGAPMYHAGDGAPEPTVLLVDLSHDGVRVTRRRLDP
jgi:hypothetical protein